MAGKTSIGPTVTPATMRWIDPLLPFLFLALSAAIFVAPSLVELAQRVWTTEQGAQGPIILATGLWLLIREARAAAPAATPGRPWWTAIALGGAIFGYIFARMAGMLPVELLSVYLALIAIFYSYVGGRVLRQLWFPLLYLLFLVPPPYTIIAPTTGLLRLWISSAAVDVLSAFGFQTASSGTTLYIDQYELLVSAACSGMNSIVSLLAIGLFYIFLLHRSDWRYAILLALAVIPIAVLANFVRVLILLLVTHYFGNAVAQGMLHEAAGLIMFFIALLALIGVDGILTPLRRHLSRSPS